MPHPKELIAGVVSILEKQYPPCDDYSYLLEQILVGSRVRMFPDIQIIQGGKVKCVVEIGYTRPEKFSEYRRRGIPDIRWYSKEGKLHNDQHIVSVVEKIVPQQEDMWSGILLSGQLVSWFCDGCYADCEEEVKLSAEEDGIVLTEDEITSRTTDCYDEDEADGSGRFAWIFTNGNRRCCALFCDVCGRGDVALGSFESKGLMLYREYKDCLEDLATYDDFLCYWSRLTRNGEENKMFSGTFDQVAEEVLNFSGEQIEYGRCGKWGCEEDWYMEIKTQHEAQVRRLHQINHSQ